MARPQLVLSTSFGAKLAEKAWCFLSKFETSNAGGGAVNF
jgi:hypothetical protein